MLLLLADSTNVEHAGLTPGEDTLVPAFEEIVARTRGRTLVSCFATSIPRMQRVADVAVRHDRPLAFLGRRMVDNAEVALDLGLLRIPEDRRAGRRRARGDALPRAVVFVSGSQGEPLSALSLVSVGEHRDLAAGPGDTVVLSARAIPGNERAVSRLIGNLFRLGCDVVHPGTAHVHVSGHGCQADLVELLRRVRPRYLVPVHGEYRMLAQHARLAAAAGMPAERRAAGRGRRRAARAAPRARAREARVPAGRVLLERGGTTEIEDLVIRDRRHLSVRGHRGADRRGRPPDGAPRVDAGDRHPRHRRRAGGAASWSRRRAACWSAPWTSGPSDERLDSELTRERVREELRRFFKRRTQRRPMVIPVVMEV